MSGGRTLFCRGEEDEADHEEIWDDTELIQAYDRALASARAELGMADGKTDDKPGKSQRRWKVGEFCRAVFSEDGMPYEAELISMGGARCRLRYVGYGNEEDQPLSRLQPSAGKKARRRQEREAERERLAAEEGEGEEEEGEDEEREGEDGEDEEVALSVEAEPARRATRKNRAAPPPPPSSTRSSAPAAHNTWGATQNRQGAGPNSWGPAWGPWGASWDPHGPSAGSWGPHPGPWGPAQSGAGPWGPGQPPHGFRGPLDGGAPIHPPMPPPPPPPPMPGDADPVQLANMLMSWYISGYHTGYYQGRREAAGAGRK